MNDNDIKELAAHHYPDDDLASSLFQLLVDVADLYVRELEDTASNEPAPFLGNTTPLDAAMLGLRENLVSIREGR